MLKLNMTEGKKLTFEIEIGGVHNEVAGTFRISFDDVEYGFPAKVGNSTVTVELPPLQEVIGRPVKEGDEARVRLDVVIDGYLITPWQDHAKLSNPIMVKAKIKDGDFIPKPKLKMEMISSEDGTEQGVTIKESDDQLDQIDNPDPSEQMIKKLVEKMIPILRETAQPKRSKKTEKTRQHVVKESASEPKQKQKILQEFTQRMTHEDIIRYMMSRGCKNPDVQAIVFEQARQKARSNEPAKILREVVKILKKPR